MFKQPKPQHTRDNRANQLNPFHPAYYISRGATPSEAAQAAARARTLADERAKVDQSKPENGQTE
jgi:hypothetical protein